MIDPRLGLLTAPHLVGLIPASAAEAGLDYLIEDRVEQGVVWRDALFARVRGYTGEYEVRVRARGDAGAPATGVETTCTCDARRAVCRHAAALLHAWVGRRDSFVDLERLLAEGADRPAGWWIELAGRLATEREAPLQTIRDALWGDNPELAPYGGESAAATVARAAGLAAGGRGADAVRLIATAFARSPARMPPAAISVVRDAVTADAAACEVAEQAAVALVAALEADDPETASLAAAVLNQLGDGWEGFRVALTRAHLRAWELEAEGELPGASLRQGRIVAWLAEQYDRRGEPDIALSVLRQHRRAWGAREQLVRRLSSLGRLDDAIAEAVAAVADTHGYASAEPRRWLGELLLGRGDRAAAGEHLAAALALRPDMETYRLLRGGREGDPNWPWERAALLRGWQRSGQARDQLAQALVSEGDFEGLADLLQAPEWPSAERLPWIVVMAGVRPRQGEALYRQLLAEPLRAGDRRQREAIAAAMTALARKLQSEGRQAERDELLAQLRVRFASEPALSRRVARLVERG